MTTHHLCHIFFVRSKSLGLSTPPREGLDEGGDTRKWGLWGPSYRLPTTETRGLRWAQDQWDQMSTETSRRMKGEVAG